MGKKVKVAIPPPGYRAALSGYQAALSGVLGRPLSGVLGRPAQGVRAALSARALRGCPEGRHWPGCPGPPGRRADQPLQAWLLKTQPVGLAVLPLAVK